MLQPRKLRISYMGRERKFISRKITFCGKCLHEWVYQSYSKYSRKQLTSPNRHRGKIKFCSYSPRSEKSATRKQQ